MTVDATLLVVEDEPGIARLIGFHLEKAGFKVDYATNGVEALKKVRSNRYALILLDLMLPEMDGLDFFRIVKADRALSSMPIVMITAKDEEEHRVTGLELGADDYITKPFSPREMVARVKAVLRRTYKHVHEVSEDEMPITRGDLRLDPQKLRAYKKGKPLPLSTKEFSLLWILAKNPGKIFSREKLLDRVWGDEIYVEPRTVDVHIRRLREKIEDDPSKPLYILTKRGAGYYFSED